MKVYSLQLMVISADDQPSDAVQAKCDLMFDELAERHGLAVAASFISEVEVTGDAL